MLSEDEKRDPERFYKKINKDLILDRYCENLQKKNITIQDIRLLKEIEAEKALKIYTEQKKREAEVKRFGDVEEKYLKKSTLLNNSF